MEFDVKNEKVSQGSCIISLTIYRFHNVES